MKTNVQKNTDYGQVILAYKIGDNGDVEVHLLDLNKYGAGSVVDGDNLITRSAIEAPGKANLVDVLKTFAEVQSATQSNVVDDGAYVALVNYNNDTGEISLTDLGKATELFHAYFGNDIDLKGISNTNFSAPNSVPYADLQALERLNNYSYYPTSPINPGGIKGCENSDNSHRKNSKRRGIKK